MRTTQIKGEVNWRMRLWELVARAGATQQWYSARRSPRPSGEYSSRPDGQKVGEATFADGYFGPSLNVDSTELARAAYIGFLETLHLIWTNVIRPAILLANLFNVCSRVAAHVGKAAHRIDLPHNQSQDQFDWKQHLQSIWFRSVKMLCFNPFSSFLHRCRHTQVHALAICSPISLVESSNSDCLVDPVHWEDDSVNSKYFVQLTSSALFILVAFSSLQTPEEEDDPLPHIGSSLHHRSHHHHYHHHHLLQYYQYKHHHHQ